MHTKDPFQLAIFENPWSLNSEYLISSSFSYYLLWHSVFFFAKQCPSSKVCSRIRRVSYILLLSSLVTLSHVQLFVTAWTVACQDPLFMEFSRQKYWSGLPFPCLGDLPDTGIEPGSPIFQTLFTIWAIRGVHTINIVLPHYSL